MTAAARSAGTGPTSGTVPSPAKVQTTDANGVLRPPSSPSTIAGLTVKGHPMNASTNRFSASDKGASVAAMTSCAASRTSSANVIPRSLLCGRPELRLWGFRGSNIAYSPSVNFVLTVRVRSLGMARASARGRHPMEGRSALERQDPAKFLKTNGAL
jgi:hypothetical protein